MGPQSPCALRVRRAAGPTASFPLLADVLHHLPRGAPQPSPRRAERAPCQYSDRLLTSEIEADEGVPLLRFVELLHRRPEAQPPDEEDAAELPAGVRTRGSVADRVEIGVVVERVRFEQLD